MIDMRIKSMFFDRGRVQRAVSRDKRRVLSRIGAFVRQRAKTSIRKRKRVSEPGQPPSSHTGQLRRNIFFGYDESTDSVVVGPLGFPRSNAPSVLEHGGVATIVTRRRRRGSRRRAQRKVLIAPRPFMGPALEKELPEIPKAFRGMVKGT